MDGCWKHHRKKTKLGLALGNAYLVPVLSHKTTHAWRFFFSFWHFREHAAVSLLVCNYQTVMAACLRLVQNRKETSSEPWYCWRLQGRVQTCLILDISLRPLGMNFQKCWVIGIVDKSAETRVVRLLGKKIAVSSPNFKTSEYSGNKFLALIWREIFRNGGYSIY